MSTSDSRVMSRRRHSPERTPRGPPVFLTVRDRNIIHPPIRTSSLKSPYSECSALKHPIGFPEPHHNKQSRNADHQHLPFSGSLLKVTKTRRNIDDLALRKGKGKVPGRIQDAVAHDTASEDLEHRYLVKTKIDRSRDRDIQGSFPNPTAGVYTDIDTQSKNLSISRPSTSLSSSTTTFTHRQPHYRRESVRCTMTKAFSALNRKKRTVRSDHAKYFPETENRRFSSITTSSTSSFENESDHAREHDSGIDMVSDLLPLLTVSRQEDSPSLQTTSYCSPRHQVSPWNIRTPQNDSIGLLPKSDGYSEEVDNILFTPGSGNRSLARIENRSSHSPKRCFPPTLRLRLVAKAELKEASLTSQDALWAIVQIHGEVFQRSALDSDTGPGISMAIILDNSSLSTQKDIEKAILEVLDLAARLRRYIDRLGVFCTAFCGPEMDEHPDCCIFHPSRPLVVYDLASQLKKVAKQAQHGYHLEAALSQAAVALKELDEMPELKIRRDIIVLSPNLVDLAVYTKMLDASFNVHLLNPGLVPFGTLDHLSCYGLRPFSARENFQEGKLTTADKDLPTVEDVACIGWAIDATRCISQDCSKHRSHSLQDLVVHSKAHTNAGTITNISISISPGADVLTIEQITGKLDYSTLLPGQIISIPIKIRLRSLAPRIARGSTFLSPELHYRTVSEMISELELTLGEHLSELFSVQVRYSHSMFPENTRLVAQESCWLRRMLAPRKACANDSHEQSVFESVVQKQLALCLAGSGPPTDAMGALEAEFGTKAVPVYCLKFVEAVKRRLRHRIDQTCTMMPPLFLDGTKSYETELQEFVDERNRQDLATDNSPATVVRRRIVHTPENESHNTARRIWQHIRKSSKPEREVRDEVERADCVTNESNARMEEIRKMALRNKRKMSTETLKSLARDYRHISSELGDVDENGDDID